MLVLERLWQNHTLALFDWLFVKVRLVELCVLDVAAAHHEGLASVHELR